jgi:predicted CXXCH cytochrome family protein
VNPYALSLLVVLALFAGCERAVPDAAGTAGDTPAQQSGHPTMDLRAPATRSVSATSRADSGPAGEHVGAAECARCHPAQARAWTDSHHDLAMQVADEQTVLGDFSDARFTDAGVTTVFKRTADGFALRSTGADGVERDFPVPFVFGVDPIQQYLVDIGGGRLQAYPIAWNADQGHWFSLYPGQVIGPDDPLHWTRYGLNWNQGCADCHSTALRRGYDPATDTYSTVWSEIDVACEACHGPGAEHTAWAAKLQSERLAGTRRGNAGPAAIDSLDAGRFVSRTREQQRRQLDACAPCHARRSLVHPEDGSGQRQRPLTDTYRPELLLQGLYHADGQILDEVYVYGSFIQSRMYAEKVVCTDCHDPHSLKLVAEGNALCTQCHQATLFNDRSHTHHAAGTPASRCVSCHMVETTYMRFDPRRDHGFHIPRPDLSRDTGVPNACTRCHTDRSDDWAYERIVEWFGPTRPEDIHETRAIAAGRAREPGAAETLANTVRNSARAPILRATALSLLGPNRAAGDPVAFEALDDPDPLVRATAVAVTAAGVRSEEDLSALIAKLADTSRLVRTEAAVSLSAFVRDGADLPDNETRTRYREALEEYRHGQTALADQPSAWVNLGVLSRNLGDDASARTSFERAVRIEPAFIPALFNLAMLDALAGRRTEAEQGFRAVLELQPESADALYALGLLVAEDPRRLGESTDLLSAAARAAPEVAVYHYNAGLAAQHQGERERAEQLLTKAVRLDPAEARYREALTIFFVQGERWQDAWTEVVQLRMLVGGSAAVTRLETLIGPRLPGAPNPDGRSER